MLEAVIVNNKSPYCGNVVAVQKEAWLDESFWIEVRMNGQPVMMARSFLAMKQREQPRPAEQYSNKKGPQKSRASFARTKTS
jgi:hypothetical protein